MKHVEGETVANQTGCYHHLAPGAQLQRRRRKHRCDDSGPLVNSGEWTGFALLEPSHLVADSVVYFGGRQFELV